MSTVQRSQQGSRADQATAAGVRRWVIKTAAVLVLFALALFASSGTVRWAGGWLYLGLVTANQVVIAAWFLRHDPALLAERSAAMAGAKGWDVALSAATVIVGPLAMCIISGLDERHNWIGYLEPATVAVAFLVFAAGSALVTWAMVANRFFSRVARIQSERGHVVVRTGPYAVVRHPGYLGALVATIATPYVLGSQWAVFVAYAVAAITVLRTYLEDRMLLAELPGYRDYAATVRYRLFPGVW